MVPSHTIVERKELSLLYTSCVCTRALSKLHLMCSVAKSALQTALMCSVAKTEGLTLNTQQQQQQQTYNHPCSYTKL